MTAPGWPLSRISLMPGMNIHSEEDKGTPSIVHIFVEYETQKQNLLYFKVSSGTKMVKLLSPKVEGLTPAAVGTRR